MFVDIYKENTMNENLKKVREALGFNKSEMAEALGITGTYYAYMEKGNRTFQPEYVKILVDKYNVRRAFLESGDLPIFRSEEMEETLAEFKSLNEQQQKLVLEMIRQFNELNKNNGQE